VRNNLVKIAKRLIHTENKEDLYQLFKLCKKANVDISKDINYDYKEKYEGSKVLMITLRFQDYKTTDRYVQDYVRCYIEVDNMVAEGIESVSVVQAKPSEENTFKDKIINTIQSMKTEILREIVSDALEQDMEPEGFLKDFKILYHYYDGAEKYISSFKDEIEADLDKAVLDELKEKVLRELQDFNQLELEFSGEEWWVEKMN